MNKLKILLAYITIIMLWATTPLAIKWSAEGAGFIFSVMLRMSIGTVCVFSMLILRGTPLPWHRKAILTYLAIALQIYAAMMAVYWASQYIPSGWLSVVFGLTPFMTAVLAAWLLNEKSLGIGKFFSYLLGVAGLALMFSSAIDLNIQAIQGICAVLFGAFLHAFSSVVVKRIQAKLSAQMQVAGGLLFAMPAYLVTWFWYDRAYWPVEMSITSLAAILYLGIVATSFGFVLYYYVLTHQPATRVALITIISPLLALWLGHAINGEVIGVKVLIGSGMIISALMIHQYVERRVQQRLE